MTVHTIEWQISQRLEKPHKTSWDKVMDHFLKVCKGFADFRVYFYEVYIHGMFWP